MSIEQLQHSASRTSEDHECKRDQATHTIHALTSELRTTKQALEDVSKRERQVHSSFIGIIIIIIIIINEYD